MQLSHASVGFEVFKGYTVKLFNGDKAVGKMQFPTGQSETMITILRAAGVPSIKNGTPGVAASAAIVRQYNG